MGYTSAISSLLRGGKTEWVDVAPARRHGLRVACGAPVLCLRRPEGWRVVSNPHAGIGRDLGNVADFSK